MCEVMPVSKAGPFRPQTQQVVDALNTAFPGLYAGVCKASDLPADDQGTEEDEDLEEDGLLSDFVFLSDGWAVRVDYDPEDPDLCLGLSAGSTEAPAEGLEVDLDDGEEIPEDVLKDVVAFLEEQRQTPIQH
ncbi:hypothetical protein [Gluconobacter oxydans]|uniref:Uncharacterized protein n=1 Tax=Gluconobacter oxydans NBRC 3293 TaxID=1315969 RepID=A0A829XAN6_GLUOY|nr:hypothetical protein [Gluconobacter oxydans]GEM18419.1 hypothetical protein NBRC3293_2916 [Gluconobacter oxydans NBRC 3293]GEM18639.1 hypothetical protein NBRC3293_3136 [Gluconobacter oxydans NBRC 3293]